MGTGTPETLESSWAKEKKNAPKAGPSEYTKKSLDTLKAKEQEASQKDKQAIEALENIMQSKWSIASPPHKTVAHVPSPGYLQYKKHITNRAAQHPERPSEVAQKALDVLDMIATSHQNPNSIAKTLGRIMQILLHI